MKIHYAVHFVMLGTIVYLMAQFGSSDNNSVEVPKKESAQVDTSGFEKEIARLSKKLSDREGEIDILKKSNEVANEKIKSLKSEMAENAKVKTNEPVNANDVQEQLSQVLKDSFKGFKGGNFSKGKFYKNYYQRLFDKLGLSEEQQEEFLALLDKGQSNAFMSINGVPVDSNNSSSNEIKEFLGNNYEEFLKYKQTTMERSQLDMMNRKLADEDKLSVEQHEQLTNILHQKKLDRMSGKDVNNQDYLNQSADILNERQQQAFEKQLNSKRSFFSMGEGLEAITITK